MKSAYFVPGLTKGQKAIFEQAASGNPTLRGIAAHPKSIAKLLEMGLIVRCRDEVVGRDRFGEIAVPAYDVPIAVHITWCQWCDENGEDEDPLDV